MGLGWPHLLLLVAVIVLLFGRGKISDLMGDVAKGIKSFKKGMAEDDEPVAPSSAKVIDGNATRETDTKPKDKTANG